MKAEFKQLEIQIPLSNQAQKVQKIKQLGIYNLVTRISLLNKLFATANLEKI